MIDGAGVFACSCLAIAFKIRQMPISFLFQETSPWNIYIK